MQAMLERLVFTPGAAASLEGNGHNIRTLEEVVFLNDKCINILVKQPWHPGGPGTLVSHPGHSVSIRDETNIKLAVFYMCHQARI
jgi:hypothetical protein